MKLFNHFFVMGLFVTLGLSACGEQKNQTATTPVGLMSESGAVTEDNDSVSEKVSKKAKKTKKEASTIPSEPVNINTASAEELVSALKGTGVGKAKVANIIEYREKNGGFKSIDELNEVKGIGDKTLEKLRTRVTISGGVSTKNTKIDKNKETDTEEKNIEKAE